MPKYTEEDTEVEWEWADAAGDTPEDKQKLMISSVTQEEYTKLTEEEFEELPAWLQAGLEKRVGDGALKELMSDDEALALVYQWFMEGEHESLDATSLPSILTAYNGPNKDAVLRTLKHKELGEIELEDADA